MSSMAVALFAVAMAADPAKWWQVYGDPELDALVEKVAANNLDLRAAAQRIAEARSITGERKSRLGPDVNFTGGTQRLRGGFAQGIARIPTAPGAAQSGSFVSPFETGLFQGGLDMKWELDFFGTNKAGLAAARADVNAEEQRREDLLVSLTAEAARNYMELRGIEERLAITRENAAAQKDKLQLTEQRARAGLESQLDVERQAVLLNNTEATIPNLENDRNIRLNRLAVLAGDFSYRPAPQPNSALQAPPVAPEGIAVDVLKRRPDVRAAEARLEAAQLRVKQARTDLYPKVSLNGLLGRQGTSLSGLSFGGGNFFSLGPQLQLPLFNFGRIRAQIASNEARRDQSETAFEHEILDALEEANNALVAYQRQQERVLKLAAAQQSARSSLDLSVDLQRAGLSDFLSVLDAQRSLLDAQFQRSQAQTQVLVESVGLYKALAGGWR
jgi:NodT family efflux transporter outer membrane factor (OMF) lipoprotein